MLITIRSIRYRCKMTLRKHILNNGNLSMHAPRPIFCYISSLTTLNLDQKVLIKVTIDFDNSLATLCFSTSYFRGFYKKKIMGIMLRRFSLSLRIFLRNLMATFKKNEFRHEKIPKCMKVFKYITSINFNNKEMLNNENRYE